MCLVEIHNKNVLLFFVLKNIINVSLYMGRWTDTPTHPHTLYLMHICTHRWPTQQSIGTRPFEIKQIKENYWWPANCLKTNDKTAASSEDGRLRDTLQGDWHLPHAYTHTQPPIHRVQREYLLLVGGQLSCGRSELRADWRQCFQSEV